MPPEPGPALDVSYSAIAAAKEGGELKTYWPALLREITDKVGLHPALKLCREYGGRSLYIPVKPSADHPIAVKCGPKVLRALIAIVGREDEGDRKLVIPNGRALVQRLRDLRIFELHQAGVAAGEIAARFEIHVRTVRAAFQRERERRADEAEQAAKKAARRAASPPQEKRP